LRAFGTLDAPASVAEVLWRRAYNLIPLGVYDSQYYSSSRPTAQLINEAIIHVRLDRIALRSWSTGCTWRSLRTGGTLRTYRSCRAAIALIAFQRLAVPDNRNFVLLAIIRIADVAHLPIVLVNAEVE
jgi:hypothetical protein